jgi:hypothetical protein
MLQIGICLVIVFVGYGLLVYHQHLKKQIVQLTDKNTLFKIRSEQEYNVRVAYQRGLGLPLTNQQECIKDLWARANQGDQTAEYILLELMNIEFDDPSQHKLKSSLT